MIMQNREFVEMLMNVFWVKIIMNLKSERQVRE